MTEHSTARFFSPLARHAIVFLLACLLALPALSGCHSNSSVNSSPNETSTQTCQRVVSLSPGLTEILYAMELGNRVVGVTRYCKYPADAQRKTQVGGYLDLELETVLRLKPDLVVLRSEQQPLAEKLHRMGIGALSVNQQTTEGILEGIRAIGATCRQNREAGLLYRSLRADIDEIERQAQSSPRHPRVLVVVDRDSQIAGMRRIFVAGSDGFYDWMVTHAGGQGLFPNAMKGFFQISTESVLRLNPDIIVEITPSNRRFSSEALKQADALKAWSILPRLKAVKNRRIYVFDEDYMVIPGPRFTKILRQFAHAIHPELNWPSV